MKNKSDLALRLKKLRREKNVTSDEVAQAIGIKGATYRRYEIDTNPKRDTFIRLADYFGVTVDYLIGNVDEEDEFKVANAYKALNKEAVELSNFELLMLNKIRRLDENRLADLLEFLDNKQ